jgi:hypothetical protein
MIFSFRIGQPVSGCGQRLRSCARCKQINRKALLPSSQLKDFIKVSVAQIAKTGGEDAAWSNNI